MPKEILKKLKDYSLEAKIKKSPGFAMQIQAVLGLASLATSFAALAEAQKQQKEASDALRGANMTMHAIQTFIGVFDW